MESSRLDTVVEADSPQRNLVGMTYPSGGDPGGSGPGGQGGGSESSRGRLSDSSPDKARIVAWFVLLVVLMTFGGLVSAYIVIKTNGVAEWRPFALPVPVWISTALLLASSLTYHFGRRAIERYDQPMARSWLIVTGVLGASFISSQILAWTVLWQRGLFVSGNPYAGFFYVLTGLHAVHVIGGITALGSVVLHAWNEVRADRDWCRLRSLSQAVGWYWHFMDGVWLVLFVMLGFWT